jgi:hypothetical protein
VTWYARPCSPSGLKYILHYLPRGWIVSQGELGYLRACLTWGINRQPIGYGHILKSSPTYLPTFVKPIRALAFNSLQCRNEMIFIRDHLSKYNNTYITHLILMFPPEPLPTYCTRPRTQNDSLEIWHCVVMRLPPNTLPFLFLAHIPTNKKKSEDHN